MNEIFDLDLISQFLADLDIRGLAISIVYQAWFRIPQKLKVFSDKQDRTET